MDTNNAAKVCFPFGKHKGKPLEAVAFADPSYLTYVRDNMQLYGPFKTAFETYMADPNVQTELENRAIDAKAARQNWR